MADISKEKLEKEIAKILKNANLANTSSKKVRQKLEKSFGTDLTEKRKIIDQLVMDYVNNKEDEESEGGEMPRLNDFSPPEIADLMFYYGKARGDPEAARSLYVATFPNRRPVPCARNFVDVYRRLSTTGDAYEREPREVYSEVGPKPY